MQPSKRKDSMQQNDVPCANELIRSLPQRDRRRFLAACEPAELAFAQTLAEPGERMRHVYFPTTGFISLIATDDAHSSLEVALVGAEGMFSTALALGVNSSPLRAIVQGAGSTLRMATAPFALQLRQSLPLRRCLDRYVAVTLAQFAQAAACTRFHVLEERLARWLMMTRDRSHADRFHLTHVFLSCMLGVRRVGVTKAATALQRRGLISYSRGDITILDRGGLEDACCPCYSADRKAYQAMMGPRGMA